MGQNIHCGRRPCTRVPAKRSVSAHQVRGPVSLKIKGAVHAKGEKAVEKEEYAMDKLMDKVVYVSHSRLERKQGPLRVAYLPGESQPVFYSVHGAIAEHYKVDPATLTESHAATIDYVISATAG